ncbi:MAG: hypothetical protein IJJ14_04635 [Coriobacteriales bacterium]|nr:hypothetical protein [Coriobacteriales bacterium]
MKNRKLTLALICALAIACIGVLAGCLGPGGNANRKPDTYFAQALVQGELDLVYLGEISPELEEAMDEDAQELAAYYEHAMDEAVMIFASYYDLDLSVVDQANIDALNRQLRETYTHVSYSVGDARQEGDVIVVPVTVAPFDVMMRMRDAFPQLSAAWRTDCANRGIDEYSVEAENMWAQDLTLALAHYTNEAGYLASSTIDVRVELDPDGYHRLNDDDYFAVDALVIYYPE